MSFWHNNYFIITLCVRWVTIALSNNFTLVLWLYLPVLGRVIGMVSVEPKLALWHYSGVIISMMAFQITGISIVCSTVCSGTDPRKRESSASLAFVREIHRRPVNSPQKGPVTRKMFPFEDVIMDNSLQMYCLLSYPGAVWNTWDYYSTIVSGNTYGTSRSLTRKCRHWICVAASDKDVSMMVYPRVTNMF